MLHRTQQSVFDASPRQKTPRHERRQMDWSRWSCRRAGNAGRVPGPGSEGGDWFNTDVLSTSRSGNIFK